MPSPLTERIYEITAGIPRGRVASYGQIALMAGNPRASRVVGFAMHNNPSPGADGGEIPCHRVVFKDGSLCAGFAFGGRDVQRRLLEDEGVGFLDDGRVDLERYSWDGM